MSTKCKQPETLWAKNILPTHCGSCWQLNVLVSALRRPRWLEMNCKARSVCSECPLYFYCCHRLTELEHSDHSADPYVVSSYAAPASVNHKGQ